MLQGMRCEYKFEKHTDEWKNPFSCQIRIFVSCYYYQPLNKTWVKLSIKT